MGFLKTLEKSARNFRDERIIKPLIRSRYFQRHLYEEAGALIVELDDHRCAVSIQDQCIGKAIRQEKGWFREETMAVFEAAARRGIFVDVGANIGTQTIYALKFGGFERAICFEPHPEHLWILKANMAINDLTDRVTIMEAAAGREPGEARLFLNTLTTGASSLLHDGGSGVAVDVPVVRIEDVMADLGVSPDEIGLVWMDVEGFEGDAIAGWPSMAGLPFCVEYSPAIRRLSNDVFACWKEWAVVHKDGVIWNSMPEFDISKFDRQVDFLFR